MANFSQVEDVCCYLNNFSDPCTFITETGNVVICSVILVLLIIGVVGNLTVFFVVIPNKRLRNDINMFLISLAVSDLISATICSPLWAYRRTFGFSEWAWPNWLCQFYWFMDMATSYTTALHISSFAVLRFAAIKFPFKIKTINRSHIKAYLILLWLIAISVSIPYLNNMSNGNRTCNSYNRSWPSCSVDQFQSYTSYIRVVYPLFFFVPEGVVVLFSILIAYELFRQNRWREEHFRKPALRQSPKKEFLNFTYHNNNFQIEEDSRSEIDVSYAEETDVHLSRQTYGSSSEQINTESASETDGQSNHPGNNKTSDSITTNKQTELPGLQNEPQVRSTASVPNYVSPPRDASREKRYKAYMQLLLITACFLIGYTPNTVYLSWTTTQNKSQSHVATTDYWFAVAGYMFLRVSECMNPFIYIVGSSNLKDAARLLAKKIRTFFSIRYSRLFSTG